MEKMTNLKIEDITKSIGFVETPKKIARLMVELANVPNNGLVLDTGCGKGVFLDELRQKILQDKNKNKNKNIRIFGIEYNKELYDFCKEKYADYLNTNFKIINDDFLSYNFSEKFDLIIGNPPYVHYNNLPSVLAQKIKKLIKTSEGDIYYAFIIKSISLLKEGGELVYIVPYHFFYNTFAKIVRQTILRNGKLEIIIDLDENRLFYNENPETIIFKFRKGFFDLENEKIILLNINTKKAIPSEIYHYATDALIKRNSNKLFSFFEVPHNKITHDSEPWSSYIFDMPDFPYIKLKEICKVGVGFVSGFDKAFILSEKDIKKLNINLDEFDEFDEIKEIKEFDKINKSNKLNKSSKFNLNEISAIKFFVKARNCKRFIVDASVPYFLIEDSIQDENVLKKEFPNIYSRMLQYKQEMSERYLPKNKKWFNWQALRNYNFLMRNINKNRIYVPTLDRHSYNRFSLGKKNLLPSGDVLFIQPYAYNEEDLLFILGYLNSSTFRKYYLASGGRRGGRIAFTQRILENAKIPLFSNEIRQEIKKIVSQIISLLTYESKDLQNKTQEKDNNNKYNNKNIYRKFNINIFNEGNIDFLKSRKNRNSNNKQTKKENLKYQDQAEKAILISQLEDLLDRIINDALENKKFQRNIKNKEINNKNTNLTNWI
ncbi:MAG: HsdM family class I SAM-dependent methyltransferase [Promethearchaeota archaeon]